MVFSVSFDQKSIRNLPWVFHCSGRLRCYAYRHDEREDSVPLLTLAVICTVQKDWPCYRLSTLLAHPGTRHSRLTPCAQPCSSQTTRPAARQSHALYLVQCHHMLIISTNQALPCAIIASCTTWHKHGQFACTARSLPHGQRRLATGSWLIVVLLCRMLLCFPVIRLHRDAASRTIDADRLEGVRWAVASMSCLVVCSSHHSASQGVLRESTSRWVSICM